ncbi:50S ribosome-binding GTPase [Candidatus Woesearchaeota archaeon]|nr:50S ribosome-binding GTPase [Candidatus Woesearchaeota archaeon]
MGFHEIKPIESGDRYLDIAIKRAKNKSNLMKVKGTKLNKIKTLEMTKIAIVRDILVSRLDEILTSFPRVEELTVFYRKLVEYTIGKSNLKKALGKIKWTKEKISEVFRQHNSRLKSAQEIKDIAIIKKSFYGRISSVLKNPDYKFLEKSRRTIQSFPTIKKKYKQVAIAGFPNVGKSTLLSKLTSSKPEIAAYAFTTKGIMVGYFDDMQLLDTPGTLNRFDKMNDIEQQAYLVMKLVAEKIIYVFDLTEPYPLKDQISLYERIKGLGKPVVIYLSKTDILDKGKVDEFKKKFKAIDNIKELKKKLI